MVDGRGFQLPVTNDLSLPVLGNPADSGLDRRSSIGLALGFLLLSLGLMAWSISDYGLSSDVGNYFEDSLRQLTWMNGLVSGLIEGEPARVLQREVVLEHWRWFPQRIPHPPLSRELSGIGYALFQGVLEPLAAYRVAVIVIFSALVAACVLFVAWTTGSLPGAFVSGVALLATPAMFAYGHLAQPDMFLAAFWFGSVAALEAHLRGGGRGWLWCAGLLLGAAVATKFTGLLLIPVLLVWLVIRGVTAERVLVLTGSALGLFFLVNPLLWVDPALGIADFLQAGFARADAPGTQIRTYYFGEIYAYRPPWHYPFVWTAVIVPLPLLAAGALGLASWRRTNLPALALLNLGILYVALLLPSTPLHDGVRLFLPAFPFFALLAGLGTVWLVERVERLWTGLGAPSTGLLRPLIVLAMVTVPILRTAEYHPYQLSYFNILVGGIDGAAELGLEVTGMKEVLTPGVLFELGQRIPADALVDPGFFLEEMCFYQASGYVPATWRLEMRRRESGETDVWSCLAPDRFVMKRGTAPAQIPDFVFVLNRQGEQTPLERALTAYGGEPYFALRLKGVPLLQVYRTGRTAPGAGT